MKNLLRNSVAIPLILATFLIFSCKKDIPIAPILIISPVSSITQISATSGGNITSDGGASVTARGVCWSNKTGPSTTLSTKTNDGTGIGLFVSSVGGLSSGTTYYIRSYATNSVGTTYSNEVSFTTDKVIDLDGNKYNTVTINRQVWMLENLKTTKYSDGTSITLGADSVTWMKMQTPFYCWYKNDPATYKDTYGALYNFYAVNTGKLCPTGWHVPSDEEWTTLTTFLGGYQVADGKLKETGTAHWNSPNYDATNESGFTALPSGYRNFEFGYINLGNGTIFWSSTSYRPRSEMAWTVGLATSGFELNRAFNDNQWGFSVRCLKD